MLLRGGTLVPAAEGQPGKDLPGLLHRDLRQHHRLGLLLTVVGQAEKFGDLLSLRHIPAQDFAEMFLQFLRREVLPPLRPGVRLKTVEHGLAVLNGGLGHLLPEGLQIAEHLG